MADSDTARGRANFVERRLMVTVRIVLLAVAMTIQFAVHGYRFLSGPAEPGAEIAVYVALAVTGLGYGAVLLFRPRTPVAVRAVCVAVLLACSVVMSAILPLDAVDRAEQWSLSVIGWYGLAVLFGTPLRWAVGFLGVHALVLTWPMLIAGASLEDLAAMGIVMVAVIGFQVGVALSARLVRAIAAAAARTSRAEERLRVSEEVAAVVARDRARRYADLRETALPLLAGLAEESLDPRDPVVRRRCAIEAARMRRLFSESDTADDRLVHELAAVIDIAERHDTTVTLSVRGEPVEVPRDVRRELLAPISDVLVTTRSDARVTVLHAPDRVRLSVRCAAPEIGATEPERSDIECVQSVIEGQLWLEVSWRSP
ncbi:hypothetical protein EV193_10770 [Herbihabitans rhizosphaerae]|uniref:Signal transduction histidine kinase n=1 Tax=Herbihabitans rhizosphaerae TaxID=1872711 RepID=A0A4Q7KIM3_9PSEU|nr:hypothetical protein [Herbihabitans rhizosphaerae]RZS36389.1 hypothetical protein EV193_10770 [Herbihabitans rhizosphaerae]